MLTQGSQRAASQRTRSGHKTEEPDPRDIHMIKPNRRVVLEISAGALAAGLGSRAAAAPGGVGEAERAANHGSEPHAPAIPANEGRRPLRLGLILGIAKDPDAAMAKVHEAGLPTCQVFVTELEPQLV